jgi:hypothetical protein
MRLLKGVTVGILLALCLSLAAHADSKCDESAQNRWLSSCGWALYEVRLAETPQPKSILEYNPDALFSAKSNLSEEFVDSCYELLAHPDRVPAKPGAASSYYDWPLPHDPCTRDEHLLWLRACESDALALPGHTRAELLPKFIQDGGFAPGYLHRRCGYLKVDVVFSLTPGLDESPADLIESVTPYIGCYNFG